MSDATASDSTPSASPYRVLARKYRPARFEDLIGQDAMVRTLSNAFALSRVHQAYLLTGVRGVGKTTTARILARAFTYHRPAGDAGPAIDRPSIDLSVLGTHCAAIIESRHIDVIEMDAASHTGIDDIREITDNARYLPSLARTKVYIIDEVHMLSKAAFNGLLKTLEEPPEHVKFVFATTEIEKVPVTVRSRCQRFDLRRIEAGALVRHLGAICASEGVDIEPEALGLVARAAEGSVRDALSMLDQAIAFGAGGTVSEAAIRAMLGVADHALVIDLFEALMRGDAAAAMANLAGQHAQGVDPAEVLVGLADFVHLVTRSKIAPEAIANDEALSPHERARAAGMAASLSMPVLSRAWQMLSKGIVEVRTAPKPITAADMVLVRLAYAADLPSPDELARRIGAQGQGAAPPPGGAGGGGAGGVRAGGAALAMARPMAIPAGPPQPATFLDVVALAGAKRDIQMKTALERDVRPVRIEPGTLEIELVPGASPQLPATLSRKLTEWTGARWIVVVSSAKGAPTLAEIEADKENAALALLAEDPVVASVLARFPGSRVMPAEPEDQPDEKIEETETVEPEIAYIDEIDEE